MERGLRRDWGERGGGVKKETKEADIKRKRRSDKSERERDEWRRPH